MQLSFIPNLLSIIRIILVVPIVYFVLYDKFKTALIIFAVAAISDGLDGYLARHYHWHSRLGEILDPLADKILLVSSYLCFGWLGILPVWLVELVILRDIVIIIGGVTYHILYGHVKIRPTIISKINTFVQLILVISIMFSHAFYIVENNVINLLILVVTVSTIASGVDYVWSWSMRAIHAHKQES